MKREVLLVSILKKRQKTKINDNLSKRIKIKIKPYVPKDWHPWLFYMIKDLENTSNKFEPSGFSTNEILEDMNLN